jgi:hypothetical protein
LKYYPIPAVDWLNIEQEFFAAAAVHFYDMNGVLRKVADLHGKHSKIRLDLPTGLFY